MAQSSNIVTRWTLVGEGGRRRTVAQATSHGRNVVVTLKGEPSTFMGPLEEAVRHIAELRTLEPGMTWTLSTDLPDFTGAVLLGRPTDDIEGIEINGSSWSLQLDEEGPLLSPDDWPDNSEVLELLFLTSDDADYDWRFTFDRAGPVCRLWGSVMWESGEEPPVIYEEDDVIAVERLAPHLLTLAAGRVGRVWGPIWQRLDASQRAHLIATLQANASWFPAWWLGEELWLGSEPASALPIGVHDLEGALLAIDDDTFVVGNELDPIRGSVPGTRRVVALRQSDERLQLLFSAAATLPGSPRSGFAVQLEYEGHAGWGGVEVEDEDEQQRLASAFGAIALAIRHEDVLEVSDGGVRRWSLARSARSLLQLRIALPEWD